jgi:hypothetical protein
MTVRRASAELPAWTVTSRPEPRTLLADSEASGKGAAADQQQGRECECELSHCRSNGAICCDRCGEKSIGPSHPIRLSGRLFHWQVIEVDTLLLCGLKNRSSENST